MTTEKTIGRDQTVPNKSEVDKMIDQLEEVKLGYLLNTDDKKDRFKRAAKSGYTTEFALIFALQEPK